VRASRSCAFHRPNLNCSTTTTPLTLHCPHPDGGGGDYGRLTTRGYVLVFETLSRVCPRSIGRARAYGFFGRCTWIKRSCPVLGAITKIADRHAYGRWALYKTKRSQQRPVARAHTLSGSAQAWRFIERQGGGPHHRNCASESCSVSPQKAAIKAGLVGNFKGRHKQVTPRTIASVLRFARLLAPRWTEKMAALPFFRVEPHSSSSHSLPRRPSNLREVREAYWLMPRKHVWRRSSNR
jgi:hypothetical protein